MGDAALAITAYPLSRQFRDGLERTLGVAPTYTSVQELRRLAPLEMVRRLRSLRADRCLLPLEDIESVPLVPILHAIAALSAPTRIELVYPDYRCERLPLSGAVVAAARVVTGSVQNARATSACRTELARLLNADRAEPSLRRERQILYLTTNLWFGVKAGGSVGHIAGVANGLVRAGHRVDLAGVTEPPLLDPQIGFMRIRPPRTFGLPYERNLYRLQSELPPQLEEIAAVSQPALIYERMSLSTYGGAVLSRARRLPLVIEYNGSEVWAARNWGSALREQDLALMAENACLHHAHMVVTVSEVLRDELLERGVAAERIVVYPNCIDPEMFDPARFDEAARNETRSRHGIGDDAVVIGFLGTFGQWHGVDVLARAIKRLVEQDHEWLVNQRVHFLLVGDGLRGAEVDEILAADPRCATVCTRTGLVPQAQAPAYLAIADVVVSPHVRNPDGSDFFGSPTKLFEYMAMAKPIVASDLDQIGQVLSPKLEATGLPDGPPGDGAHELALLTEPGNVDEVVRGIRFMVENPEWRLRLGENARREALARYTWRHHVEAILNRTAELGLYEPEKAR